MKEENTEQLVKATKEGTLKGVQLSISLVKYIEGRSILHNEKVVLQALLESLCCLAEDIEVSIEK